MVARAVSAYAIRISPADVGARVTVRARTNSDPPLTDAVGWLRSWTGGVLTIERRDGSLAEVAEGDLVAGKVLGPPPQRGAL